MSINEVMILAAVGLGLAAIVAMFLQAARPAAKRADQRGEAYFKAMFPELQPHFHPEKVVRIVRDRNGRVDVTDGRRWEYPAGFDFAAAEIAIVAGRERMRLLDLAGTPLAEFFYERQPAGGALRVGRGKLTAGLDAQDNPRVRYWHPEREFKWSRKGGWQFTTPVAERPIESDDRGSRFSSDSGASSSSPGYSGVAAAAGAAVLVSGAGGAFAGGGASESWEAADGAAPDAAAGTTAY